MLGLLGLRVFEAGNSTIADLGEEHGHREPTGTSIGPDSTDDCRMRKRPSLTTSLVGENYSARRVPALMRL